VRYLLKCHLKFIVSEEKDLVLKVKLHEERWVREAVV